MSDPTLTPWPILTTTAGLIAFHIGLFTLVGRERKSPYVINSVFPIFLLCLLAAAIALSAALVPLGWRNVALTVSAWCLVLAFLFSIYAVYRIAARFVYFVDSVSPKHLPVIREARRWWRFRGPNPTYEHSTLPIDEDLKGEITRLLPEKSISSPQGDDDLHSLAIAVDQHGQGDAFLAALALAFLSRDYSVQYMTASRHPIEFIDSLKTAMERNRHSLAKHAEQIFVVDAYSPHFAFIDSIYPVKTRNVQSLGITCVESRMTYAGVHSASSRAFKEIKKRLSSGGGRRKPTLVIYEDFFALTDLESLEQYRIFVRHVFPSERMWGGMLTVFLESGLPDEQWTLLNAYASLKVDLRLPRAKLQKARE